MTDYFILSVFGFTLSVMVYFLRKLKESNLENKRIIISEMKKVEYKLLTAILADDYDKKNMIKELDAGVQLLLDLEKERTSKEIDKVTGY